MKKQLLPQKRNFYKANMHLHTTLSDGKMTPEEVKAAYKAEGYSIIAFTDHEVIVDQKALRDESFLPITSLEVSFSEKDPSLIGSERKCYHLNLYAKEEGNTVSPIFSEAAIWNRIEHLKEYVTDEMRQHDAPRQYDVALINEMIAKANAAGFLVSYNHPVWSQQNYTDYAPLKGIWGVEVYNSECVHLGQPDTVQPYDDLLRLGNRIYPLATDDMHSARSCFGGWLMVSADRLDYGEVMTALEKGDFYASTGPEIYEISVEDGIVHVSCSPAAHVSVSTECREARRISAGETPVTDASFGLSKYFANAQNRECRHEPYFRVTVTDASGKSAWSRAYFSNEWN
ncbi:MAG: PHP domain-containing protein [Clostridia bacterium]|nr:PHP domain-containing protein [Clostridia bacterium]